MKYEVLSQNLKKFRKKAGLTQKELAKKIYKSEILIRKYESGKINIPPSTLAAICVALNVSDQTLLGSDFNKYYENNFNEVYTKNLSLAERAVNVAENYKEYGDSWRDAVLKIESSPKYLLYAILNYLENKEEYYPPLFVNVLGEEDDSMPYLTNEQINDIVKKITELVKYEIYKLDKLNK
ncbi:transcriptional repressor DicA [Clostridium tepidiprofundi DSM 19306]|uniref:Transcriptional repressor DicA n=1 Tax=Clostridium tepidiprofundi DSM 19306 TaxID=1121338 RepID=A0A151B6H5_9CLOT|nr:helix-turn-helix transcriptional regulator [Clostridium tepidiprofundi]KYH35380.1 transcriptional repressor DicA [Clostridium tepidiprofundi DSM 19306]